ncbi:MAG: exodeoxyribonuclease VII large subunit [bacterium]|nr:exodeoxyribonuclease VII large subunit [bacterium]
MFTEPKIYTVTELNEIVNAQLSTFTVRVKGEISDFRVSGKFVYFDLKDEGSRINCFVMAFQLQQELEDGMEVIVSGSPGLYVPYGKYTFRVRSIEPVGDGALRRAFELTKKKLEAEGLFAPEHKKPIPRFPERIGLITSKDAAAYTDFLRILNNRWGGVEVLFLNVKVQGEDAVREIVRAFEIFNTHMPAPDILVLTRGGGSLEDLAAFNSEQAARAIFASRIPVVVGVGHERDTTLSDLVGDFRASTPSNAAECVVPSRQNIAFEVETFRAALDAFPARYVNRWRGSIRGLLDRMDRLLRANADRGRLLSGRLHAAWAARLKHADAQYARLSGLLTMLNPQSILRRGYSITRKNGKVIKDAATVKAGERIETIVHKGRFEAIVD